MSDNILDFGKFKQRREEAKKAVEAEVEKRQSGSGHKEDEPLLKAVSSLVNLMSEQDKLIQMMIEDIISLSGATEQQSGFNANVASSVAALVTTLEEKGLITSEEIQKVWERDALPTLQQLAKKPEESRIIQPPPGFIIP